MFAQETVKQYSLGPIDVRILRLQPLPGALGRLVGGDKVNGPLAGAAGRSVGR